MPLLLVMAVTNRGYILDLVPGQSLVEFLLSQGYDVFMVDWNPPRPEEKKLRLEDYVLDFIPDAVRRVQQASGEHDVNLVGYCMGGVLSTLYAALHAGGPVKNLAIFTTPIDFTGMKLFSTWADKRYFDVDRLVDTAGNAPPELIYASFDMLRPADKLAGTMQLIDKLWNDEYVKSYRMFDRWASDILPLPGEFFRQTIKELMWENRLFKGELVLGGRRGAAWTSSRCRCCMRLPSTTTSCPTTPRGRWWRWPARPTRRSSCSRAATSASWPGATRSSGCGRDWTPGWESARHDDALP